MESWMLQIKKGRTLRIVVRVLFLGSLLNYVCANNGEQYNAQYSIVEEHQICDHIIPKFIEQIMNTKNPNCGESGVYPKPGNCSVFFKCVQSDTMIQPFVEYCAVGYNFVNRVCVPNINSTDCPQYTCRIPDGTNEIGNEIIEANDETNNDGNKIQSLPLVVPDPSNPSTSSVMVEVFTSTSTTTEKIFVENTTPDAIVEQMGQSETSLQMTQTLQNSPGSNNFHNNVIISFCIIATLSVY